MIIGIPKEILKNEKRVAAVPKTVSGYIKLGFKVLVEASAGEGVYESDDAYLQSGAEIVTDVFDLYRRADIILKVKEPCLNNKVDIHELDMLKEGSILITFLHPAAPSNHDMVRKLRDKQITAFTMDSIPRTPRAQRMDALTSMSTITGYKSVLIAANFIPIFVPMIGTSIGMVKPANFLVIGTGVVGLQAIATAKRLGGVIKAVDIRQAAREEAATLGAKIAGFDVPEKMALGEGGYAGSLSDEWLNKEREALQPLLSEAHVIILCALVPGEVAPILITESMFESIKPGTAIIDVSIDQGGNFALTEPGNEIVKNNVYICGIRNIPGSVPVHSTWLYANNMYYYVENLFKKGLKNIDFEDDIVRHSLVTRQGKIFHTGTLKSMRESL
jgi:H+-translocating NAD(P) transhydrogenase subunit alpha